MGHVSRFHLYLGLVTALLGCGSKGPSRDEYLAEYLAIARDFEAAGSRVSARPLPDPTGLSRSQRLQRLGDQIKADAAEYEPLLGRAKRLQPPSELREHKRIVVETIAGLQRHLLLWGEAIASGNRSKAATAGEALDNHLITSMDNLIRVTRAAGGDVTSLQRQRDALAADLGR